MDIQRVPSPVSIYDNYSSNTEPSSFDIYVEETFYEDGEIEEIFAYDNQELSIENELQHKFHVPRNKKKGYPPITPFACTRDATFSNVLEALWPKVNWGFCLLCLDFKVAGIQELMSLIF